MVNCSHCGKENKKESTFCIECGAELTNKSNNKLSNKITKKSKDMIDPRNTSLNPLKSPFIDNLKKMKSKKTDPYKCPACRTKNNTDQKSCLKCGKNFSETLGFFKGSSMKYKMAMDLEITPNDLIIYPRNKITYKRKKTIKRYKREDMKEIRVGERLNQLSFRYNGKRKKYTIQPEYVDKIERLLLQEERVNQGMIKEVKGRNGKLALYENKIIIRRNPRDLKHGYKGNKEIPLNHISAIQLNTANRIAPGRIQFSFPGSKSKYGDENTVFFKLSQEKEFYEIKKMIESQMLKIQNIKTSNQTAPETNSLDDLEKLAELKNKGIITEEEFQAKKKQILGL